MKKKEYCCLPKNTKLKIWKIVKLISEYEKTSGVNKNRIDSNWIHIYSNVKPK